MPDNTCICCGKIIPEGQHICLACGDYDDMQTFRRPEQKPKTNGDRIRSMSDEALIPVVLTYVCRMISRERQGCPCSDCDDCVRFWLRKEARHDERTVLSMP